MKLNNLFVILLIQVICETLEYDLRCPVAGEWRQRPRKYKCGATQYVCLLFLPNNIYRETCDGRDYSSRGSKLVFEPNFNKAKCNYNRYQPFPFSTDGSSDCVYKKSLCNGEGQFVYHNGTLRNNTRCGCHFLHGFTFVTKPKNNCFCIPSEEDCSCHKITCNDRVLNSDTHCREDVAALLNISCSDIIASLLPEKDPTVEDRQRRLTIGIDNYNKGRLYCSYITVVVLITLIGIAILMIYILITDHLNITVKKENEAKAIDGITELFLECEIDVPCSCLVRSIQWYKENIECSSDPTKYDWNKKVPKLTFKTVDENVVGSYKCVVDTICTRHISKNMCVFYGIQEQPSVGFTESVAPTEEDNFYRLFYLSNNVGTNALRRFFNKLHPNLSADLHIPGNKALLRDLYIPPPRKKRVLYRGQWDTLYPPPGKHVTTDDLDLTLLVCLLRQLPPVVTAPATGFDMLPIPFDISDGAKIACLKYYQHLLRSYSECKLSSKDFLRIWNDLEQAIIGLDNSPASREGLKIAEAKRFHK